jgi:hypothetical protein
MPIASTLYIFAIITLVCLILSLFCLGLNFALSKYKNLVVRAFRLLIILNLIFVCIVIIFGGVEFVTRDNFNTPEKQIGKINSIIVYV